MRTVIQRVNRASVAIGGNVKSQIERGLLILVGVCEEDTMEDVEYTLKAFKEIKAKLDAGLYDGDDIAEMTIK